MEILGCIVVCQSVKTEVDGMDSFIFVYCAVKHHQQDVMVVHWWFSGRILTSHAGHLGSIPMQCNIFPPLWSITRVFSWCQCSV